MSVYQMLFKSKKKRRNKKEASRKTKLPFSVGFLAAQITLIFVGNVGIIGLESGVFGTFGYAAYFSIIAYFIAECINHVWLKGVPTQVWFASLKRWGNSNLAQPDVGTFITNPYIVGIMAYMVAVTYALTMATWVYWEPVAAQAWMTALLPLTEPLMPAFPVLSRAAEECADLACAERVDMYRHMLPMGIVLIAPFVALPLLSWRKNYLSPRAKHSLLDYGSPARQNFAMLVIILIVSVLMVLSHLFIAEANLIDPVSPTPTRGSFGLEASNSAYSGAYMFEFFTYYVSPLLIIGMSFRMYRLKK